MHDIQTLLDAQYQGLHCLISQCLVMSYIIDSPADVSQQLASLACSDTRRLLDQQTSWSFSGIHVQLLLTIKIRVSTID